MNIDTNPANYISILSILCAVYIGIRQHNIDQRLNKLNLNSVYFNKIFQDLLVDGFPKARKCMTIDYNDHLIDTEPMIEKLREMRNAALYYKYADKEFYDKLVKNIYHFEDYLVTNTNNTVFNTNQKRLSCMDNIHTYMQNIYKLLDDYYKGKLKI